MDQEFDEYGNRFLYPLRRTKTVNDLKVNKKIDEGFGLFEETKCSDLFANVKIKGKPMYNNRNIGVQLRFKYNLKTL